MGRNGRAARATETDGRRTAEAVGAEDATAAASRAEAAGPMVPGTRHIRVRAPGADTWSVMAVSFLTTLGLGLCVAVTLQPVWLLARLLGHDPWPPVSWGPGLLAGTVVVSTVLATLCAFLYNVVCRWTGSGLRLTLAEDLPALSASDPAPRTPSP